MDRSLTRDFFRCIAICTMIVACGESLYFMNDLSTASVNKSTPTYYNNERIGEYYYQQEVYSDTLMEVNDTIQGYY